MLYSYWRNDNDTVIKTHAGRPLYKYTPHFIARVRKGLLKVCVWEGAGDRTETAIFWPQTYGRQRCVFLVLLMLNRRPWTNSAGWWLLLLHLISNFSGPQTPSGFLRAPSAGCGFPYHISPTVLELELNCLSYIIVQRPLDRPLDLWNRMFNRHQAEITVMQFRGHSLPVRQSMRVSWYFFSLSHFVSQFLPTRFPLLTAIGMCHFLPVHHLEWHFGPGRRSKHNNFTNRK